MIFGRREQHARVSHARISAFSSSAALIRARTASNVIQSIGVNLDVAETTSPTLLNGKLWAQHGWVRGDWPLLISGDSPSGVCSLSASVDGQLVASQSFPADTSAWHQCDAAGAGGLNTIVHTTQFSNGAHQLTASAQDAAGLTASSNNRTTINIDNATPTVALSGPTDAPSTAGTQYITASASAGPSGVAQISCSLDGAPGPVLPRSDAPAWRWTDSVSTRSPARRLTTRSTRAAGTASLRPATASIRIGVPTVTAVGFTRIVNGLRCHRATERRTVPAHWATRVRHHRRVRVRVRARTPLDPRRAVSPARGPAPPAGHGDHPPSRPPGPGQALAHGSHRARPARGPSRDQGHRGTDARATVSGWLGTADGVALGGQTVTVLTAPDDGGQRLRAGRHRGHRR